MSYVVRVHGGREWKAVRDAWSTRAGLRAGYGAIIAVLVLSALEAYDIQVGIAQRHLEIYRQLVERDEALATLRRNLWLTGSYVRDFFINTTPQQGALLSQQVDDMRRENEDALRVVEKPPGHPRPELRRSLAEFWAVVEPIPRTMIRATNQQEMAFLDREIVPRRGELYNALRALTFADRQQLQDSEGEIAVARRSATRRLLAMLGIGVLLSFLVARRSLRHAANMERKAAEHVAELQQLSGRLLEIEEEGRKRLSRELHDELGQTLALLQIEISNASRATSPGPGLDRARALAERTVQTVRNMSVLLRPALLDDLGLAPALQFQLEGFIRRSGIACDFVEDCVDDNLPETAKTCVYRVVQEALHNAEKHSQATRVTVSVKQFADRLVAEIDDNGCGFGMDTHGRPARSSGLGLLGMRERAVLAGGSLTIDSTPGRGTRVTLLLPVVSAKEEAA